jgi:THO complex subunit 4
VEELDAEMVDYFNTENGGPAEGSASAAGAVQQPANGSEDLGMAEISVSYSDLVRIW